MATIEDEIIPEGAIVEIIVICVEAGAGCAGACVGEFMEEADNIGSMIGGRGGQYVGNVNESEIGEGGNDAR